MSFAVTYNFIALNQFSGTAKQIAKSAKNVTKSIKPIGKELVKTKKITRTSTKSINRSFKTVIPTVKKLNRAMKNLKRSSKKTGKSFIGSFKGLLLGAGLFVGIKKFITVGGDFQDSLADLSAITGATGKDLSFLSDETLRLAKVSITAQTEVAQALKIVGSQKAELLNNIPALIAVTDQVLLLKNAAGIELFRASEIVTQSLNIFGAEADQTARFVNVLAAGAKFGASEIADTGAAVILSGAKARSAGISFEELNAIIQATAKGGFKGTQAGTALSAIIGRLTRMGIDFRKSGIEGGFQKVKDAIDAQIDPTKKAVFIAKIFGEEHDKVGLSILNNINLLGEMTKKITGTRIAQEQAKIRLGTFNRKLERFGIIIKDKLIRLFIKMEPLLNKIITRFGKFIDKITPKQISDFGDQLKIFIKDFVTIGEVIGKVLKSAFTADNIKQFRIELSETLDTLNLMIKPLKFFGSIFKGFGTRIGEAVGQVQTGDIFGKNISSFREAFSVGGDLFGVLPSAQTPTVNSPENNRSTVDINLNAPKGVIDNVKTNRTGTGKKLNVGVNMKESG